MCTTARISKMRFSDCFQLKAVSSRFSISMFSGKLQGSSTVRVSWTLFPRPWKPKSQKSRRSSQVDHVAMEEFHIFGLMLVFCFAAWCQVLQRLGLRGTDTLAWNGQKSGNHAEDGRLCWWLLHVVLRCFESGIVWNACIWTCSELLTLWLAAIAGL